MEEAHREGETVPYTLVQCTWRDQKQKLLEIQNPLARKTTHSTAEDSGLAVTE